MPDARPESDLQRSKKKGETMKIMPIKAFRLLAVCLGLLFVVSQAAASQQSLVVFGDSFSDTGNAFLLSGEQSTAPYEMIPSAAYAIGGHHFSNGRTWIEVVAANLGASARPVAQNPRNTNYAVGGARARGAAPFDLGGQVSLYLNQYAGADNAALHVILIGG